MAINSDFVTGSDSVETEIHPVSQKSIAIVKNSAKDCRAFKAALESGAFRSSHADGRLDALQMDLRLYYHVQKGNKFRCFCLFFTYHRLQSN